MAKRAILKSLGNVDIRLVRVFVAVAECGGLAASEPELNIGRSTISKHIADLEMRMGLKLCNRGPAGFSLTPEGEQVLASARRLLNSIDLFQSEVDNIHENLTGTLRLGLFDQSTTNPNAQIHKAIQAYDELAPDVLLDVSVEPPNIIEARIVEGTLDLGIVPVHRPSPSLRYRDLYREHMTLYCGEGHPLFSDDGATIDVARHKYAGFGFNSPNMTAGQSLGLRRAARVQDEEALSLLIQSGAYLGFLADHSAAPFVAAGKVKPVDPENSRYVSMFAAITRKHPEPDRKTIRFLNCLTQAHGVR
ncbi:LysR family transcriptional regulator [Litoreibacter roseus]|uniref:LysR family transcriptional regulator n=1 Tax=Litoreibacter roseus TaxID=2601869 RepID=A0A6N6JEM6_9RHOB|nr:LysR family transcriptional regulator [Litoreibacter roseus]GFE64803.1 LysR family transcriptional regulator [Litoreibacter roseus]